MTKRAMTAAVLSAIAALASGCAVSGPVGSSGGATPSTARSEGPGPSAAARRGPAPGIGVLGRFGTAQHWLKFTEPAHTGPTGAALGPRTLRVQVWYPLAAAGGAAGAARHPAAGPLPLIAFGPGFMQCGRPYSRLLRAWASAGYVVAVVNFPRSDCEVGAAATESDLVNQPADMSYVITRMLALSAAPRGLFSGLLSSHEI